MDDLNAVENLLSGLSGATAAALYTVVILIAIVAVISIITNIWLGIAYHKYNRTENSAGLTGEETARRILDRNGLEKIKVKVTGSLMFGNSYSHYFKKVRLRRLTRNKTSLTALAMGSQKAALAVLDKENDSDMKKRIHLTPLIYLGPIALIPLIVIGVLIDIVVFNGDGNSAMIASVIGIIFYALSLTLSILNLRTEKKGQERAYELLRENGMATENEISELHKLFKLYNIQYINDIIMSTLELIYRILLIFSKSDSHSSDNN